MKRALIFFLVGWLFLVTVGAVRADEAVEEEDNGTTTEIVIDEDDVPDPEGMFWFALGLDEGVV